MKAVRRAFPYAAVALAAYGVLFHSLRLRERDLRVPLEYAGDGLFYTVVAKAVSEDGFSRFERLGAPFGMDLADWPTGMLFDFSVLGLLTRFLGEAGLALNLYWIASVVLTALLAAWSLRRLDLEPALAFPLGLLYGLLPYAFYRNVGHISMAYHFVPLLGLLLVRVAEGHPERASRAERWTTRAACVLQGLSYPYYGFFASALLVLAAALGSLRARSRAPLRSAALAVALLTASTAVCLAPSVLYWREHGPNPDLQYKTVADTDVYGLKIRQLVTPIPDHPLAPLREVASRVAQSKFPLENENASARLGTVASLGFLLLLGVSIASGAGRLREAPERLQAVAGLNLGAVLLATIGGLGSLFAVFASAQVRAWNRIVVFNAFFGLLAVGLVLGGRLAAARARGGHWARFAPAAVATLLCLAVLDQSSNWLLVDRMTEDARRYWQDRAFVRAVEQRFAPGSRVFQLPHTPTPLDRSVLPMQPYDHARAYLHSRTLAWSWGAIAGRHGNWQAEVAWLPPPEMLRRLALAGFAAVWLDRSGWAPGWPSPYAHPRESPESTIVAVAGLPAQSSPDGRYAVVGLGDLRRRLETALGPAGLARAASEALLAPVAPRWPRGFTSLEGDGLESWRWGARAARLVFRNAIERPRRLELAARLEAADEGGGTLRLSGLTEEELPLGEGEVAWRRTVVLPPGTRARIDFAFESPTPCRNEARCFRVLDFTSSDLDDTSLALEKGDGGDVAP
jgi:phosphoglycerol transferase